MQANAPQVRTLNLAALHTPVETLEPDERDTKFDASDSLTGDPEQDQLLLGIIISLVQILLRQFNHQQQQQGGNSNNNNDSEQQEATNSTHGNNNVNSSGNGSLSSQFNDKDKNLLLNAIGTNPASGTTINDIDDTNASGHLNSGDNLELLTNSNAQTHTLTNPEVSKFIDARNPPGTPKLPLTAQQTSTLESRYGLEDVTIADTSSNQNIGIGDILTGIQIQNGTRVRVDIPVDQAMLNLLGA